MYFNFFRFYKASEINFSAKLCISIVATEIILFHISISIKQYFQLIFVGKRFIKLKSNSKVILLKFH